MMVVAAALAVVGGAGACNKTSQPALPPPSPEPMHAQSSTVFIPNDPNKKAVPIDTVTDGTSGKSVVVAHSLPRYKGEPIDGDGSESGSQPTQQELIQAEEAMEPLLQDAAASEAQEAIEAAEAASQTPQAQFDRKERSGRIIIPGNIVFATGKATLADDPESEVVLEDVYMFLRDHPKVTLFRIEGHTDSVGTPFNNLILSGQRALTIKAWLVDHGIDSERILATGFGDKDPIADNAFASGRAQNRRVEFYVVGWEGTLLEEDPSAGGRIFGM